MISSIVTTLGRWRRTGLTILLPLVIVGILYHFTRTTNSSVYYSPRRLPPVNATEILSVHEAQALCSSVDFPIYPNRTHPRRVYDLFMIDTELDWLEIRLNELQHQVDYFVIVEATTTFTGNKKPLHLKSQYDRFEKFHPKIILHTLNLDMQNCSSWDREGYTRNALFDAVFPGLTGPMVPNPGDVIVVSDVDEIPRPVALTILRNCQFPEKTTLRSRFFYYSFQWQHVGDDWPHPQATYYKGLDQTIRPQDLRASTYYGAHDLWDASWHCSSCFSTVAELSHKIESFSHTEYDRPEFKTASEIVRRVRNGLDLFDREKEKYEKVDSRIDVPQYIERNQERFAYLLDRDPANANFVDYENEG